MGKWLLLICIVVITVSLLLQRKVEQVTGTLRSEAQTTAQQEATVNLPAVIDRAEPIAMDGDGSKRLTHAEEQLSGRVAPVQEKSGPGEILAQ